MKIVIVGGVAGGASAATRARRINPRAEIVILEKGPAVSFANCGLPYHVGGEIAERDKLFVASPELFWKRFRIEVRTGHEVVGIDRRQRLVDVLEHATGCQTAVPYDRLILSQGSEPNRPVAEKAWPSNVSHLWTIEDMDRILRSLSALRPRRSVVVGAGFVGLEVVEQLHRLGIHVTLVERNPQVLMPLDREMAAIVERTLVAQDVEVKLGNDLVDFEVREERAIAVKTSDGSILPTDLVIVGAGVRPRVGMAAEAGLTIGPSGGVAVNAHMQTSDPCIYAVGDMVESFHGVLEKPVRIPLAGPANRGGRIAGEHAASGQSQPMGAILGTSVVRVFDQTAACTGMNEKGLQAQGIPYRTAIVQATHHAGYFPGAQSMQLKLLYAPDTGRLLGGQGVGGEGVDKRIDILATTLHFKGTIYDLAQLDLAYAPPYGSAKDPIHQVAFTAINDLSATPRLVPPSADLEGRQVVDVRTAEERHELPFPTAIPIDIDDLPERWRELDPSRPTAVICHTGKRAHIGACWLRGQGFPDVVNVSGGMAIRSLLK